MYTPTVEARSVNAVHSSIFQSEPFLGNQSGGSSLMAIATDSGRMPLGAKGMPWMRARAARDTMGLGSGFSRVAGGVIAFSIASCSEGGLGTA